MNNQIIHKRDTVYYARIHPSLGIYDLDELVIRTVAEEFFVGIEKKEKRAFLFPYSSINKTVFVKRQDALNKIKEAETNKPNIKLNTETYYEEY